jgi:hypothetical protein
MAFLGVTALGDLVDRLRDRNPLVSHAAERALWRITGMPFGTDAFRWHDWAEMED